MCKRFFFFLLTFAVVTIYSDYAPACIADDDVDYLLYRLSARYGLSLPQNLLFHPLNTKNVESFFTSMAQLDSGRLSTSESYLISKLERYIDPHNGLVKWSNEDQDIHLRLYLNLLGDLKPSLGDQSSIVVKGILGPQLTGNLGKLSFYSGIDVWTEYRSDTLFGVSTYQPYDGLSYNLYGRNISQSSVRSSDLLRGGIRYDAGRIQLETAIDYLKVGPAVNYPLTLSGTAPP